MSTLYRYLSISSIFFILFSFGVRAQVETAPAGQVMLVSGQLTANQPAQTVRLLKRGSPFFVADTLITAADSQAQLRFTDGTLIALRPNSTFKIDQYHLDNQPHSNNKDTVAYTVSLLQGGFRSISGKIAKMDPTGYKINTHVATIGVRGTEFSLMLDDAGGLGAATYKGLIYLNNQAGYIEIGDGAEYGYAYIASKLSKPQGEPILPSFMLNDPRIVSIAHQTNPSDTHPTKSSICLQ